MKKRLLKTWWLALIFLTGFDSSLFASTANVTASNTQVTITLTVGTGTPPFTYQWRKDGVNIPGATNPSLALSSPFSVTVAGVYDCTVTNAAGSVNSDTATLVFLVAPGGIVTGIKVTLNGQTRLLPLI